MGTLPTPHDMRYQQFFDHSERVRHLLMFFVPGINEQILSFHALARVVEAQTTEDGRARDLAWKIKLAGLSSLRASELASGAQVMHDAQMATKTISIETDVYDMLVHERNEPNESFSRVIRRLFEERPALTCADLMEKLEPLRGKGAGRRRKHAAA